MPTQLHALITCQAALVTVPTIAYLPPFTCPISEQTHLWLPAGEERGEEREKERERETTAGGQLASP